MSPELLLVQGSNWRPDGRRGAEGGRLTATPAASLRPAAFTLVETVIATVIVAVMFVAALNTVGASRLTQHRASLVSQGRLLAESLMSEILVQSYEEPDGPPAFGRESGELATTRAAYDDVDDYHGWSASPPAAKDGTPLANTVGWTRTVRVEWVDPPDPEQVKTSESGAKLVTVTAAYRGVPQASFTALKTAHD